MTLSHVSEVLPRAMPKPARVLQDVIDELQAAEALENPDAVLSLRSLRMNDQGSLQLPEHGPCELTDWSRRQLATMLGVRWDQWFATSADPEKAEEVNRRLQRSDRKVRLRTNRHEKPNAATAGVVRALVSPGYSPIGDSFLAGALAKALGENQAELRVSRFDITDRTTSYVVVIGRRFGGDESLQVGDLQGGVLVRNSGVGYASLHVSLYLTRVVCSNGMTAPLGDAIVVKRAHRGLCGAKLEETLSERLKNVPRRLWAAGNALMLAGDNHVDDVRAAVHDVLRAVRLPLRHTEPIMAAWAREPWLSAFGVSQAITLAAQRETPELRFELERAAGTLWFLKTRTRAKSLRSSYDRTIVPSRAQPHPRLGPRRPRFLEDAPPAGH